MMISMRFFVLSLLLLDWISAMTQRWMQQKLLKMKRMKRAYLKSYPSQGIDHRKIAAYDVFANGSRVKTIEGPRHNATPISGFELAEDEKGLYIKPRLNQFMQEIPVTKIPNKMEELPSVKARELSRHFRLLQTDRTQRMEELIRGPLLSDWKGVTVHLWFSGPEYYIIKEASNFTAYSFYTDRAKAYADWQNNRVIWDKVVKKE